jgi:copper chaperone CopZ
MRKTMHVMAFLLAVTMVTPALADSRPEVVRTAFVVEGMHCDGCSSAITSTVGKLDGVLEVAADHEAGSAEVVYRPRSVDEEDIKEAIEKLGYTVTGSTTEAVED